MPLMFMAVLVQKEVAASHIEKRKDTCIGFDTRMQLNEKASLAQLHRDGLQEEDYGNQGVPLEQEG